MVTTAPSGALHRLGHRQAGFRYPFAVGREIRLGALADPRFDGFAVSGLVDPVDPEIGAIDQRLAAACRHPAVQHIGIALATRNGHAGIEVQFGLVTTPPGVP